MPDLIVYEAQPSFTGRSDIYAEVYDHFAGQGFRWNTLDWGATPLTLSTARIPLPESSQVGRYTRSVDLGGTNREVSIVVRQGSGTTADTKLGSVQAFWNGASRRFVRGLDSATAAVEATSADALAATAATQATSAANLGFELRNRLFVASLFLGTDDPGTGPVVTISGTQNGSYESLDALIGGYLTRVGTVQQWRITAAVYNATLDLDTITGVPVGHTESLLDDVAQGHENWSVSAPVALPGTAPSGYGASTQLRTGPFDLTPRDLGIDGTLTVAPGDILPLRVNLTSEGETVSLNGTTLVGALVNSAGVAQTVPTVVAVFAEEGAALVTVTAPATTGTYYLAVRREASATDKVTFGPISIQVRRGS